MGMKEKKKLPQIQVATLCKKTINLYYFLLNIFCCQVFLFKVNVSQVNFDYEITVIMFK